MLWIDQETFALLRLVPPLDLLREQMEAEGPLQSLSLVVEFTGAKLDAPVDPKLFTFDLPKDAETVKYFLPPPARLLAKKAPALGLRRSGGQARHRRVAGRRRSWCLCYWDSCVSAVAGRRLPLLEPIYEKYKNNDRVAFLAVSLDDAKVESKQLQKFFDELKVHVPIVREAEPAADPLHFKNCPIISFPPVFVLGPGGILQYFDLQYIDEKGGQPSFAKDLPGQIDQLLAGKDVYPVWFQLYDQQQRRFQEAVEAAAQGKPPLQPGVREIAIPQVKIAPHSDPKHLKLTSLWKCHDLKQPGNILVVPRFGGSPRLAIIDSWKSIAEMGLNGKLLAPHTFNLQKEEAICNLRTAVGGNGKRLFVAFANGQQRAHLFDENWNLLASYPADALENRHSGIADVQLADLEGDGSLRLYVGYYGVVGLQAASLEGKRLFSNRLLNNVHMAVGPAEEGRRRLICTNSRGSLAVVDSQLQVLDEIGVPAAADPVDRGRRPGRRQPPALLRIGGHSAELRPKRGRRLRSLGPRVVELRRCRKACSSSRSSRSSPAASPRAARANGSCPAPTARSTSSTPTANSWTVQLWLAVVRPGDGGDRRQAGAGGGHARQR